MKLSPRRIIVIAAGASGIGVGLANAAPLAGVPDSDLKSNPESPLRDYSLRLGEMSFDPLVQVPAFPGGWDTARTDGPDLRLVQFTGPTLALWLEQLEDAGISIVQYIDPYTYIVWSDAQNLDAVRHLDPVRWAGEFYPAYRVLPKWRNLPDEAIAVKVLLYRGADTDAAIEAITELGGRSTGRRVLNSIFKVAGFVVSGARFQDMARIPGVYSIQPIPTDGGLRSEMSDQVCAGNYDVSNLAFPGYQSWLGGVGVDGAGVIIANVDGGIQNNHPDLVSRLLGCSGVTCGGGATSSHGTHTAGIMAADGSSGVLDSNGFLRGLGVAPGANLVEQLYSPTFTQPDGMLRIMTDSYNNGASLSGNSWGPAGTPQGYDDDTMQVDIGVRDADPNVAGNQPLTYVLSFMNGNGGISTQGTPDEAKNLFNIGSTKMQNSDGSQILDIDDLSSNTAHGPALDGRTIPHMVAPGCRVDSSTSGSSYTLMCGTSMASPHVSGAVALFIEYYRNRPDYTADPSPALIKAAFLPVAHNLVGNLDADGGVLGHPFDNKQGWGRLDIPPVIDPPAGSVSYFDQAVVFDNTGEEWSVNLFPLDPTEPIKIMLVWTDAPGHGLGGSSPAWNNNLDLIVEEGGDTYRGNNFGFDGWSVPGGSADFKNNTEGVFLGPTPPGNITVRVVASNINSDSLPGSGDTTDQDFALVAYNAVEEATGACCFTNGSCTVETSGDCITFGGSYQGDGSNCSPNPCPPPPSAADIASPGNPGFPDGCVDSTDLTVLLGAWCSAVNDPNPPSPPCENCTQANLDLADIAGPGQGPPDGCVDSNDLTKLLGQWCSVAGGNPCGTCGP
ncbi:MAG: S8 family serine peptidase [Planctomycetes bacterium]|nr:S8 family serine peptidase [Planctomycetota bacterium]